MDIWGKILVSLIEKEAAEDQCPSDNDLAEFYEGVTARQRIQPLIRHINGCERCQTTLSFLAESLTGNFRKIISFPVKPKRVAFSSVALAACLALAIWIGIQSNPLAFPEMIDVLNQPAFNRAIKHRLDVSGYLKSSWTFSQVLPLHKAAVISGILSTELELALRLKDDALISRALIRLAEVSASLTDQLKLKNRYIAMSENLSAINTARMSVLYNQLFAILDQEKISFYFSLGAWTKGAELAAGSRNGQFFDQSQLDYLAKESQTQKLPPGVIKSFHMIRDNLEESSAHELNFRLIESQCRQILDALGIKRKSV